MISIFWEGASNTDNGDLRAMINRLFEKRFGYKKVQVIPRKDIDSAIKSFLDEHDKRFAVKLLLIDADGYISDKETFVRLKHPNLVGKDVYFMVQQMEAWFFAHPSLLCHHFNINEEDLPVVSHPEKINNPKKVLKKIVQEKGNKTKYSEIRDGASLLQKLDYKILETVFSDVRRLSNTIEQILAT